MQAKSFTTPRTARYYQIGEASAATCSIWFCLHKEGQSVADFAAQLHNLNVDGRLLVLPEGLSRYALTIAGDGTQEGAGATWLSPDALETDLHDLTVYLDGLARQVLASCASEATVTVLGYGHGAAAACLWLANSPVACERLILYAAVFPPEIDRRATLAALPDCPVTVVATTEDVYTPEAAGEGLVQDLLDAGLKAQLRYVSSGPLTLAALGPGGDAAAEPAPDDSQPG